MNEEKIELTELAPARDTKALELATVNPLSVIDKRVARTDALLVKLKTSSEQYNKLLAKLGPEKLAKTVNKLESYKYGINAAAPLMCFGPSKCPFFQACPLGAGLKLDNSGKKIPQFDSIDDFPVGDQCILEKVYVEQRLIDYITEFEIDPNRASELSLINDLALIDLQKQRCVLFLSAGDKNGEGLDFIKIDEQFDAETGASTSLSYKEHPIFNIIDRLEKRRHRILEELVATRKGKAHAAAKFSEIAGQSQLLKEIEMIRAALSSNVVSMKVSSKLDDIWEIDT